MVALFLFAVIAMWGKTNKKQTKKQQKNKRKKPQKKQENAKRKKQVSPSEKPMLIKRGTDKRGKKTKKKEEKGGHRGRVGTGRIEERGRLS